MPDVFTRAERSAIMRAVKSCGTTPEEVVARLIAGLRRRCRRHDARLPGRPDFVFVRRRRVIFVHGCYWHRHACPEGRSSPASNPTYWTAKFARNRRRDRAARRALTRLGWSVLIVWECQTRVRRRAILQRRLARFLGVSPTG
jgi:DNA mismatch endonuclease (patch repair protein)